MLQRNRLGQPGGDAELQRMAATVVTHAERLSALIEQLLDVARLQQGDFAIERQVVDLGSVVEQAVDAVRQARPAPDVAARLTVQRSAALPVRGDVRRLVEVIHKLLSSAVKFSPPGTPIRVSLRRAGTEARSR